MNILHTIDFGDGFEIKTIRKDFKKRSEVKVRGKHGVFMTYRFDNIKNDFESPYINWENLNCCGGWAYKGEYLENAVQNNKKLFAQLVPMDEEEVERILSLVTDDVDVTVIKKWNNTHIHISKKGRLCDHIDINEVFEQYEKYGIYLDSNDKKIVRVLSNIEMKNFNSTKNNTFGYCFANPRYLGELIFGGLLLGYPIESTVSLIQN